MTQRRFRSGEKLPRKATLSSSKIWCSRLFQNAEDVASDGVFFKSRETKRVVRILKKSELNPSPAETKRQTLTTINHSIYRPEYTNQVPQTTGEPRSIHTS